jgi:short-subunit dehydrogenase
MRAADEVACAQLEESQIEACDGQDERAFAAPWQDPIDLLINNAGVSTPSLIRTVDGFESGQTLGSTT